LLTPIPASLRLPSPLPLTAEFELLKADGGQEAVSVPEAKTPRCGFSEPDDGLAIPFATIVSAATPLHLSADAFQIYRLFVLPKGAFRAKQAVDRSETPRISMSGKTTPPEKKLNSRKISSGNAVDFFIIMRRRLRNHCMQDWWVNTA
jgi:hypothetical protein